MREVHQRRFGRGCSNATATGCAACRHLGNFLRFHLSFMRRYRERKIAAASTGSLQMRTMRVSGYSDRAGCDPLDHLCAAPNCLGYRRQLRITRHNSIRVTDINHVPAVEISASVYDPAIDCGAYRRSIGRRQVHPGMEASPRGPNPDPTRSSRTVGITIAAPGGRPADAGAVRHGRANAIGNSRTKRCMPPHSGCRRHRLPTFMPPELSDGLLHFGASPGILHPEDEYSG